MSQKFTNMRSSDATKICNTSWSISLVLTERPNDDARYSCFKFHRSEEGVSHDTFVTTRRDKM